MYSLILFAIRYLLSYYFELPFALKHQSRFMSTCISVPMRSFVPSDLIDADDEFSFVHNVSTRFSLPFSGALAV